MKEMLDHPFFLSFQVGVNLVVNAIADSYLLVDGPNCVIFRTSQIQGNHDWCSDLLKSSGIHRVADTDCTTERAAVGDDRLLIERLRKVDEQADCGLILLTSMSPVAVTGRQYDKIITEMDPPLSHPVVSIPCGSLTGDWLLGYRSSLENLARQIPLKKQEIKPEKLGIVGYLWDRNEADNTANRAELEKLLLDLGLEPVAWWLGGKNTKELYDIGEAGTLISFPYAGSAAKILAERTGASVISCDLPIGLDGTCSWIRKIAAHFDLSEPAELLVDKRLHETLPKLKWIVPHGLLDRNIAIVADPHLGWSTGLALEELGCNIVLRVNWSDRANMISKEKEASGVFLDRAGPMSLSETLSRVMESEGIDLVITNSNALISHVGLGILDKVPFLELGFPSFNSHCLYPSPYMGFDGVLRMVDRVYNALARAYVRAGN